jgi:Kef-type K+ transport system membrane component KefB
MLELLTFFIILAAGLAFSEVFRRLHLPYVSALVLCGMLIGPFALNLVSSDGTIAFLGSVGLVFLMFMAGSEIKTSYFFHLKKRDFVLPLLNGGLPFISGFMIGQYFGYNFMTSLTMGIVFISSSIAVIIPSLESLGLLNTKLGRSLTTSVVFEDISGLMLLAVVLQSFTHRTVLPLPLYIATVIMLLVILNTIIGRAQKLYLSKKRGKDLFESELRLVLVALVGTVLLFETLGMHSIIAGFVIGILLSDIVRGKVEEKIHTVSYGIFIPVFFIIIGMEMDLSVFYSLTNVMLTLAIVFGTIFVKIISGWIGGRILNFSNLDSLLIGFSTTAQLSTTLAAAFVAMEFGLLGPEMISSFIVLTVVTTFMSPLAVRAIASKRPPVK